MRNAMIIAKRELVVVHFAGGVCFLGDLLVLTGFFTFMMGNFFARNDASCSVFVWHPWLYMLLRPQSACVFGLKSTAWARSNCCLPCLSPRHRRFGENSSPAGYSWELLVVDAANGVYGVLLGEPDGYGYRPLFRQFSDGGPLSFASALLGLTRTR